MNPKKQGEVSVIDLNDIGKYKENNRIEAKKAQGGLPISVWETYSSFANSFGGIILFGVVEQADKSFQTVPLLNPEKLVTEFWSIVSDRQKVSVNILSQQNIQIVESQGNRIVVIEVPRATRQDKPVYIGENPFAGTYRRNGEGDYHCTADEVRNMMRDQTDISQDLRVLETMTPKVFDYNSVKRYRICLSQLHPEYNWDGLEDRAFLQNIGALAHGEDGKIHPTVAGLLMFGQEHEIIREFPYYFLDYQEKLGDSSQWTDRIISSSSDWSGNLSDFYFRVCKKLVQDIKPCAQEDNDGTDVSPVHQALREALMNALIHANYYDRHGLLIQKMRHQIIISNPGGFRISVTDAVSGGLSDPRNDTLIKMFNLIKVSEHVGGLPKIHAIWKQQGWHMPII